VLLEVPLIQGGPAFVPVQFKGKEYRLVLDTGCSYTFFDQSLRGELGKPRTTLKGNDPNGSWGFQTFAAPEANVGRIHLNSLPFVGSLDIGVLRAIPGGDVRGILGMDVLKDYVVRLDFDRGKMSIEEPNSAEEPEVGEAVEIAFDKGVPFLYARVMDRWNVKFLIDTGDITTTGALHRVYFESILDANCPATMPVQSEIISGTYRSILMRIPTVKVGSFSYEGLILEKDDFFSRIGWSFLSRHNVVLDFPHRKVYLSKGRQFGRRDGGGFIGLFLKVLDGKRFVSSVDPDGPAAQAGIRTGDEVLMVDHKSPNDSAKQTVDDDLYSPGTEVTLTIRRGTEKKVFKFVVAKGI
jgi:hypothetical protein